MVDSDDASAACLEPTQYVVQQIGGGRRRSPTPVLETPTRLRPRRRPTYADSDDVRKTLGIRSKPRTTGQDADEATQTVIAPTCPPTSLRALPPVPCTSDFPVRSSTSRQSSLVPTEPPVLSSTSRQPSLAPTERALPPVSCTSDLPVRSSTSRRSSLAPTEPPVHLSTSRQPSLAPTDEAIALTVHHAPVPSNGPSHPPIFSAFRLPLLPSTTPLVPPTTPPLPPTTPPFPVDPLSRPPSAAPQVTRIHPAGPRKPSGSHPHPPLSDHDFLPFTHQDTLSDPTNETEDVITIRPPIPRTCIIPPTPQHAGPSASTSGLSEHGAHAGESATQQAGVEEVNPNRDVETGVPVASTPATPSGGRRSAETLAVLNTAYAELDDILDRVSSRVGLTQQQVLDSWHKSRGRVINGVNHWNVYQVFFKAHEGQELQRIGLPLDEPGM